MYQKYADSTEIPDGQLIENQVANYSFCAETIENREIGLKVGETCQIDVSNFIKNVTGE